MHDAIWVDEPYIGRLSTQAGPYDVDLHNHPTENLVDWVVFTREGNVLADGLMPTFDEAKVAAWLAIGQDLGYVSPSTPEVLVITGKAS